MNEIDVIIPWVDGNDPEWQKVFNKYKYGEENGRDSNSAIRYRDWDNLQYILRGIEKFMPWVRKVHIITCGQKPSWLNLDSPKLNFVTHKDFLPEEVLPTFSVRPIELNLHKIEGLADRFIYFNDDFFVLDNVPEDFFFQKGLPVDIAALNSLNPLTPRTLVSINNLLLINKVFKKKQMMRRNPRLWYRLSYGQYLIKTLCLTPWAFIPAFQDTHMPQPYLKSTFKEVWDHFEPVLAQTTTHRFRDISDVNQSLFRYWQIASGQIAPRNVYNYRLYYLVDDSNVDSIVRDIRAQKKSIMIMNDGENISDFESTKNKINAAFDSILPEKSSFEL